MPGTNEFGEQSSVTKPLHGAAADQAKRAHDRRVAAQEHLAEFQSFARLMVAALGGIDAIRSRLGRDDALRVAALAGLPVDLIAGQWAANDPGSTRQVSRQRPDQGYDQDPAHDQRVIDAVMSGAPLDEVGRIQRQVTKEFAAKRAAAMARTRDRSDMGIPGVAYDAEGVPQQRSGPGNVDGDWDSINHRVIPRARPSDIWRDLPDHQAGYMDRASPGIGSGGMPAPAPDGQALPGSVIDCDHDTGGKFCSRCGARLPAAARG